MALPLGPWSCSHKAGADGDKGMKRTVGPLFEIHYSIAGLSKIQRPQPYTAQYFAQGGGRGRRGWRGRRGRGGAGLGSGSPSLGPEILSSEALFLTQEDHADFLHPPGSPDPTGGTPSQPTLLSERVGTYGFTTLSSSIPSLRPGHSRHTLVNSSFHKVVITH